MRIPYRQLMMFVGLGAAMGGDVCLAVLCAPPKSGLFLAGVCFFLLAHLLWTAGHLGEARPDPRILVFAAVPLVVFCGVRLWTRLPPVTASALVVYAVASSADLATAFATRRRFYFHGIALLVLSDVMIGGNLLRVPGAGWLVGPLYIPALALLYISAFRREEPRLAAFGTLGRKRTAALALAVLAVFVLAALVFPGGGYNPCLRMLSALGRTEIRTVEYPLCHYLFTLGMLAAAYGTLRTGRDPGAAVCAAGLLTIAAVPENVNVDWHNAGCWVSVAGGVVMLCRRRTWFWGVLLGSTALAMGCFLALHEFKLLGFSPWVTTTQKMLILLFMLFLVFKGENRARADETDEAREPLRSEGVDDSR